MDLQKGKIYKIKNILQDKPLFMNYGLMEETHIKIVDKSLDNKTFYLEVVGFNRKIAISIDFLLQLELEEINDKQEK